jgi:hypothetical protein
MISKFWNWYNRLKEPWRLLLCLLFCAPFCFGWMLSTPEGKMVAVLATVVIAFSKIVSEEKNGS